MERCQDFMYFISQQMWCGFIPVAGPMNVGSDQNLALHRISSSQQCSSIQHSHLSDLGSCPPSFSWVFSPSLAYTVSSCSFQGFPYSYHCQSHSLWPKAALPFLTVSSLLQLGTASWVPIAVVSATSLITHADSLPLQSVFSPLKDKLNSLLFGYPEPPDVDGPHIPILVAMYLFYKLYTPHKVANKLKHI